MCPFCLATLGLAVAGAISTGGLAALAFKAAEKKYQVAEPAAIAMERSNQDVNTHGQ